MTTTRTEAEMWADIATLRDDHAAARAELDALSAYLGQPRGRLLEGAQRLVDHNQQLSSARASAVEECKRLERLVATWQTSAGQIRVVRDAAEQALLAIGGALEVVGTGKPWAEIGKAGVEAVALLNTHLKTARQGWADESAAACRARVERDKSRAEVATLQEQVARLRADGATLLDERNAWEAAARTMLSPLSQDWTGAPLRERAFDFAEAGWKRADVLSRELTTLRDAARTLLPADSTPNPATGWLADVIRSRGPRVRALEAEVESLTAGLRSLREQRTDITAELAHSVREVADLRGRLAAAERSAEQQRPQVIVNLGGGRTVTVPEPLPEPPFTLITTATGTGQIVYEGLAEEGEALRRLVDQRIHASRTPGHDKNAPSAPAANDDALDRAMLAEALGAASRGEVWRPDLAAPARQPADLEPLRRAASALIDAAAMLAHPKAA